MIRGIVVRLFPNQDQEIRFNKHIGSCQFLYNYLLEYQTNNYKNGGKYLQKFDMIKLITDLKKTEEYKFLNEVSTHSLQLICTDLDQAFKKFFRGTANYPKFKSYKSNHQSFPVRNEHSTFYFKDGYVQIPCVGKVKYQLKYKDKFDDSDFNKVWDVRIKHDHGKWILTFGIDVDQINHPDKHGVLGIDLGVKKLAVCNFEGQKIVFDNINKSKEIRELQSRIKHLKKIVDRKYHTNNLKDPEHKWKKTNSIIKYENMITRDYDKIANIRANQRNQIISQLIKLNPEVVCMEDLDVSDMLKNKHLSKPINEMGFYLFREAMMKKCELNEIKFVLAPRTYPSSQICCKCGCIKRDLKLSDRIYKCDNCGNVVDRDYNAAVNLSHYGMNNK